MMVKNEWGRTLKEELDWQLDALKYALEDMETYFPEGEIVTRPLDDIDAKIVMVIAFCAQDRVIHAYEEYLQSLGNGE